MPEMPLPLSSYMNSLVVLDKVAVIKRVDTVCHHSHPESMANFCPFSSRF